MSQTDSFIDEVTEEVRRDRLFRLFRRWGWVGIVLIVLIVGGAAYTEWRSARDEAAARAFGDSLSAALQVEGAGARAAALASTPPGRGAAEAMRQMLIAAAAQESGDKATALTAYDRVAAMAGLPVEMTQLALLKKVMLAGGDMPAADRGRALELLSAPGAPFRLLAQEQQALDLVAAGDHDAAVAKLRALLAEDGVSAGLRRRATQLMVALGADPAAAG